jgi:hypothetical protein
MELQREKLADERRREEREERRRDEERAEVRRKEERQDELRREEAKQAAEREERRRDDERAEVRRREERENEAKREQAAREAHLAQVQAANSRTEMIMGVITTAATALAPMLEKLVNRAPPADDLKPLMIAKLTEKRETDPITMMFLKDALDRKGGGEVMQTMFQGMAEASKLQAQMSAEGARNQMAMTNEFQMTMMKKVMDMATASPAGQTEEGKNMIENIAKLVDSAGGFIKSVFPSQPAQPQPQQHQRLPHQQQRRVATQQQTQQGMTATAPQRPAQPAQATAAQPVQPHPLAGQVVTEDGRQWEQLTADEQTQVNAQYQQHVQQQAREQVMPKGTLAVLICLKSIHTKEYGTQADYQELVKYLLSEMPIEMRVAVLEGNEPGLLEICKPVVESVPELEQWMTMTTLMWIREFVPNLIPHIEAMHGSAAAQRAQLDQFIAQAQAQADAQATQATAEAAAQAQAIAEAAVKAPETVAEAAAPVIEVVPIVVVPDAPISATDVAITSYPALKVAGTDSHLSDPDAV